MHLPTRQSELFSPQHYVLQQHVVATHTTNDKQSGRGTTTSLQHTHNSKNAFPKSKIHPTCSSLYSSSKTFLSVNRAQMSSPDPMAAITQYWPSGAQWTLLKALDWSSKCATFSHLSCARE